MKLAGKEITVEQKPFVEKDIAAARKVLSKLMKHSTGCEVSSTCIAAKISEE